MRRKAAILLFIASLMVACTSGVKKPVFADGQKISGSGTFTLLGSEPLARPAIRVDGSDSVLYLDRELRKSKGTLIGKKVRFSGTVTVKEMESADKKYRHYEYQLSPESADSIAVQ